MRVLGQQTRGLGRANRFCGTPLMTQGQNGLTRSFVGDDWIIHPGGMARIAPNGKRYRAQSRSRAVAQSPSHPVTQSRRKALGDGL